MSSDDNERTNLMSTEAEKQKKTPDWSKFGLTSDEQKWASPKKSDSTFGSYQHGGDEQQNDLFREEQVIIHSTFMRETGLVGNPVSVVFKLGILGSGIFFPKFGMLGFYFI